MCSEAAMTQSSKDTLPTAGMSAGGCLVRLGWMLFGGVLMVFSVLGILRHEGFLSIADAVFWAGMAACIVLRYVDIKHFHGHTGSGEPSTMAHWRRYTLMLLVLGAAAWGVAHALSYYYVM
jgi:hypothetical protein